MSSVIYDADQPLILDEKANRSVSPSFGFNLEFNMFSINGNGSIQYIWYSQTLIPHEHEMSPYMEKSYAYNSLWLHI